MRTIITAAGLALFSATAALAVQTAPGGAAGGGGEPLLVGSQEPNLSTDPASIDDVRHKMQKDKRTKRTNANQPRPAQPAEVVAGKPVYDTAGLQIAMIEKIDTDGAIIRSGERVIKAPVEGFGVNKKGLLLNLTKAQFDQMMASSGVVAPKG